VRDLLSAGATIRVVAPAITNELANLVSNSPTLTWVERAFINSDVDDVHLVVTATGDTEVDGAVFHSANERGVWVNSADDPERCTFYMTALVHREPVVAAVTTSGASPALAAYLRRRLDNYLEAELAPLALMLCEIRDQLHDDGVATESLAWRDVVDDELVALAVAGKWREARAKVQAVVRPEP
jgi:siroheme synthase-like protein